MDKKLLLSQSLARIMVEKLPQIKQLYSRHPFKSAQLKSDGSPVTALDLALSDFVEKVLVSHFPEVTIYSEENFSSWQFPLMAIDPLDGTREYMINRPEWAVSIAHFTTEYFKGEGWVYAPATDEVFNAESSPWKWVDKSIYYGEVSHTEWENGLFEKTKNAKFIFSPKGSIAYKLARLSAGKTDFVVSLTPKNIWDVAGGTLLCQKSGIKFYSQGKEVREVKQLYLPPLIWCHQEIFSEISELFPLKGIGP